MGDYRGIVLRLKYVLPIFGFVTCVFIVPAMGQRVEPEPRLDLVPEFLETFDDPAAPGWVLSSGAVVEGGILHLDPGGAQASYGGIWNNYTSVFRMHRSGPGAISITFTTAGQDSIRLVLGSKLIEARRVRPGVAVDMIVERPIPDPPEIPVGEWFMLYVTQLDTSVVVAVDGVRLYNLYDPSPDPLPPGGLALSTVGSATVEVDRIAVIPWVIENFDRPLSSAWELSTGSTTPFVQDGRLIVPPGGYAVRTGNWRNITYYTRVRRDGLVTSILTYPGHVLELHHNFVVLFSETQGQMQRLGEAFLPELKGESDFDTWMDVMVVVRDGVHHVLAYGIELFSVSDEVIGGAVSAEAIESEFVLDRLMIGPPVPPWSAGSQSNGGEPDSGQTGSGGPGGSEPSGGGESDGEQTDGGPTGILSADLAVTDLYPDQAPTGRLYFRITNNGPDALQGAPVTVTCGGLSTNVTTGAVTHIPDASQGTFSIILLPGQTQAFPTSINLDLNNFDYDFRCTVIAALGSGVFTDPNPSNNSYAEEIAAVLPNVPSADLAVTDIFLQQAPSGPEVYCRITNNGPDAVHNVTVQLATDVQFSGMAPTSGPAIPVTVTLQPGQTSEFGTGMVVSPPDILSFQANCRISLPSSLLDPDPGNNSYSEQFGSSNQNVVRADLAVTDIFPQTLPQGNVYCRITNNGPDALQNASVQLDTYVISDANPSVVINLASSLTVSLQPGQTGVFDTGTTVDTTNHGYEFTCQVRLPQDPNPNNNLYTERIEQLAQVHLVQTDLAVTDVYPDNLPIGNVWCRIINNGPDVLVNTSVDLHTEVTSHAFVGDDTASSPMLFTFPSLTLQAGETFEFNTGEVIGTNTHWYEVTCEISVSLGDPYPGNNSYSEQIGSPPQIQISQADLAVTDIYPDSLPNGNVYCRITNNGPDAVQNLSVQLVTTMFVYNVITPGMSETGPATPISVTLQPGETGVFDTGYSIADANHSYYVFTCEITAPVIDPDRSNNTYSEAIGTMPP